MLDLWNYVEVDDFFSLGNKLSKWVHTQPRNKLRGVNFISHVNPVEALENMNRSKSYYFSHEEKNDFHIITEKRIIKKGVKQRSLEGTFFLYKNDYDNIWTILTTEDSDFFDNVVMDFVKKNVPFMSHFFLSGNDIRMVFDKIYQDTKYKIMIDKAVLYTHKKEGKISYYKHKPYDEVFNRAENEGKYINKVGFEILNKDGGLEFRGFISRDGTTKFLEGKARYYFKIILPLISEIGLGKNNILENKERTLGSLEINTIEVEFSKDVIRDVSDNKRVLKALSQLKNSSLTVYHANPYLHASVLDYTDGSSHDIFVSSSKSITIVPSFIATEHSLINVIESINKYFLEGELKEGKKEIFTYEDFFSDNG